MTSRRSALSLSDLVKDLHPGGVHQAVVPGYKLDPVVWVREKKPFIESKDYGDVPFDLYPYQEDVIRYFWEGGSYFIKKSRQRGFTTCILAAAVPHKLLYGKEVQGVPLHMHIVADTGDKAQELMRMTKVALTTAILTPDERARLTDVNPDHKQDVIRFAGGGYVRCHATKQSAVRGFPGNAALIEEASAIDKLRSVWRAMNAMVLKRRMEGNKPSVWVVSTPSTDGLTFFDELIEDAKRYGAIYLPYDFRSVPGCESAEWEAYARSVMGDEDFNVEYALESIGANEPLFNTRTMSGFTKGAVWYGSEPQPGHRYSKGLDISGSTGSTVFLATDVTARPVQPVYIEIIKGSYEQKRKRIAELDEKYPGPLHADGTWSASFVGNLDKLVRKLVPVRFTGGNDVGKSVDKTEQLTWAHWPRKRLVDGTQTLVHNGTALVFEQELPKLWYALRKARRALPVAVSIFDSPARFQK